jgi:hypothetical protein
MVSNSSRSSVVAGTSGPDCGIEPRVAAVADADRRGFVPTFGLHKS